MNIADFHKISLIDYPGHISTVVFTRGCSLSCPYCYNVDFRKHKGKIIDQEKVIEFIKNKNKNKKWITAVVIIGGEPTEQKDLFEFCEQIKKLGLKIKIDTNGHNYKLLKKIVDNNLVDYIAMDVKIQIINNIKHLKAIKWLKRAKIDHEFRITCVPKLIDESKIMKISKLLKGNQKVYLQEFKNDTKLLNKSFEKINPFTEKEMNTFKKIILNNVKYCSIR